MNYRRKAMFGLAQLKEQVGEMAEALNYYKDYMRISDSLHVDEVKNSIEAHKFEKFVAERKYDIQALENENKYNNTIIKIQNITIASSVVILIVLLILLFVLYRRRLKINFLYHEISQKNHELHMANEELNASNEELNEQQKLLNRINKSKDKLFSIIGHDLKSPFNSLLGFLSLLNKDWDVLGENDKKEIVKKLFESSEKTYLLLENLLNWGKTQQGMIKPGTENFNLDSVVKEIAAIFQSQLKQKDIKLDINISAAEMINTDKRLLSQIIQNLINNAIKFTPVGGSITIFNEFVDGKLSICVKDTGIGFPDDKVDYVFDLDFDFNRPGTSDEKSSGMGLILCKEYSKLINAKLSVKSKENEGSTFCLVF
jgi:signal transduction histidine kinase